MSERCPECGHAKHGRVCFNMASDNDCYCTAGMAETPATEQNGEPLEKSLRALDDFLGAADELRALIPQLQVVLSKLEMAKKVSMHLRQQRIDR